MRLHRLTNLAIAAAILLTLIGIQVLDASDLESEMQTEQREWQFAVQHCVRAYGVQAQPEYREDGILICRTRRGQELPYKVASK
jgi:hypothetical protein